MSGLPVDPELAAVEVTSFADLFKKVRGRCTLTRSHHVAPCHTMSH